MRTRLTHTLEVAQISRDMARRFMLNEDLSECIALAHDLGHPPFGHSGEEALSKWLHERGSTFEHNEQSLRIVTVLEYHSALYLGLNLNREVVEGLQKHTNLKNGDGTPRGHSLEAQLVNICDEVAYTSHDCDDGIRAGILSVKELTDVPLARRAHDISSQRGTHVRGTLINLLTMDLQEASTKRLKVAGIKTLDDVYNCTDELIEFSDDMRKDIALLRTFLNDKLYMDPRVAGSKEEGKEIVRKLCTAYEANPPESVTRIQARTGSSLLTAVKDYVAGMTDGYAREQERSI